jgi:hypothetical protein
MSKSINDLDLMRYVDGDLDSEQERAVAKEIVADASARQVVEGIAELGEYVRTHLELEAERVPEQTFASMWQRIERHIDASGAAEQLEGDGTQATTARELPQQREPRGQVSRPSFWEHVRAYLAGGAVAAAAVLLLVFLLRPFERVVEKPGTTDPRPIMVTPAVQERPAEIESLEVFDGAGIILTVPSRKGENNSNEIVWISEEEDAMKGPI